MSRPSLRVWGWLLAACSARTSELLTVGLVILLVGVADFWLARQQLMSSPGNSRAFPCRTHFRQVPGVRLSSAAFSCGFLVLVNWHFHSHPITRGAFVLEP